MTDVIFKYPLPACRVRIRVPSGAKLLSLQLQQGVPTMWMQHSATYPDTGVLKTAPVDVAYRIREYRLLMTGESFNPEGLEYIGTLQMHNGIVIHVYEVK